MIILGLTGSIGMGKSTTANMFRQKSIAVHDADAVVHEIYKDPEIIAQIEALFTGTTDQHGVIRTELSKHVIGNAAAMKKLENIIHPLVRQKENTFLEDECNKQSKLVVLDIPLLFETDGHKRVDKILVVTAPLNIQRERVLKRDGMTVEKFEAILKKQIADAEKRQRADFIIDTSLGMVAAQNKVDQIVADLTQN